MSFIEDPRYPECVAMGPAGGPAFKTDIVVVNSGREQRNQRWSQSLARYEVGENAKRPEVYEPLLNMFHIAAGKANAFRFKDWMDYTVIAGQGFFTPVVGVANQFQMLKRYTWGSFTKDRIVNKPVNPVGSIIGGVVSGVDYTTGIVLMTSGTPTSWTGEFDVPCRFDVDEMNGDVENKTPDGILLINWRPIQIVEVRV